MFPSTKEEYMKLTAKANLIPVFQEFSAALETPLSVFLKLNKGNYGFLLESVEKGTQVGRYSFIGVEPFLIFQGQKGEVSITSKEKKEIFKSKDPLKELEGIFQKFKALKVSQLAGFSGGAVGYLGHDMIRYWERLPLPPGKDTLYPDCFFIFPKVVVIFDHVKQKMQIVVNCFNQEEGTDSYQEAKEKIREIVSLLKKPLIEYPQQLSAPLEKYTDYLYNCSAQEFQQMVVKAKEHIGRGDIFQVVLSRKATFSLKTDPILIYKNLRSLNPSPYMFYLSFADIKLIGSSPEVMVKVDDGRAQFSPIAGTRPRGKTWEEDQRLSRELLEDEKEKAEHLMLVDLGRNDLGKVSRYGSVQVEKFMEIENYSHVKHLVSTIVGDLKEGYTSFDVLRATFPAGTLSGAPKLRALEIIDQLEPDGRGPYGGAVGYIDYDGNMDTCITIRTLIIKGNKGYVQAGAGIVADSHPEKEYQEGCNKAEALLKALEAAERSDYVAFGN